MLQADADRYFLASFVTGDDLGQTRDTVTGFPVRGINKFRCQLMGCIPSRLERALHEGDHHIIQRSRRRITGIETDAVKPSYCTDDIAPVLLPLLHPNEAS